MRRIFHVGGHSAATVIRPRGGVIERSGIISSTPSKPQNDGENRGHTISTFRFEPSGGNKTGALSFFTIEKGSTESVEVPGITTLFPASTFCRIGNVAASIV